MWNDLRFTFRLLFKERWYTAVAVLAVALGIGVNATGFSIVNAAFIRGPVFKDSDRVFMLSLQWRASGREDLSFPELQDLREQSHSFLGIAAFDTASVNISDDRSLPEEIQIASLTANAFGTLGLQPMIGRDFTSEEDKKGAAPVALIGYRLWKNRYGADPNILGTSLRVNGQAATIVGVMPDRMNFPINSELWVPFVPSAGQQERRDLRPLKVFGRLRQDVTLQEAQTELRGIAQRMSTTYPESSKDMVGLSAVTFTERFVGGAARVIFIAVMGAAGFVLLIACANVANLLLSRSAARTGEVAVRIAMGASRWRVLRQLLLESIVLACLGGPAGLLFAFAGLRALDAAVTDPGKPYWIVFSMDYTVLAYTVAICILTGIIFGLAPALHVSKANLNDAMKQGGRGNAGSRRANWFSGSMVVVELALTIVLLVGAGLMIRSFFKLYTLDVGFPIERVMAMRLRLPQVKYATPEARRRFFNELEPRIVAIPGVEAVAISSNAPPFGSSQRAFEIEGQPAPAQQRLPNVATVTISPDFFAVLSVPVRKGRVFNEHDGQPGFETVIVNEKMAEKFFPGEDPIGKRLWFTRSQTEAAGWRTIVGVSPSIRQTSKEAAEITPVVYLPFSEEPKESASVLIRSSLTPASVMDLVRQEVRLLDQDQPVFTVQTIDQIIDETRWPFRVFGSIFVIFATIALLLSAVGIYAVMAYAVVQRTPELGVRIALGAQSRQVSWLVLKRGLTQLGIGLAVGLAGALALSRTLQRALVQVTPTDPLTFASILLLTTVVALAACLIPARRATKVDPVATLRS